MTTSTPITAWQSVQLARHPDRPQFLDYANALFTEMDFLSGDRLCMNDNALLGGLARFNGQSVMVLGQQKGRTTAERIHHRFGMPNPDGYRKALRLADMAERFNLPIISFIDTAGAYPGIDAEERGQAEAIAHNLAVFSRLKTPIISIVIGEGGSGGALAIGVCDRLLMLSNSVYSVISPEGCASILWKTGEKAADAAEALGLTAHKLAQLGLVDHIVDEGAGAHLEPQSVMNHLQQAISTHLTDLIAQDADMRCQQRYQKLMSYNSTLSISPS